MKQQPPSVLSGLLERVQGILREYWRQVTIAVVIVGIVTLLIPKSLFHPLRCTPENVSASFTSSNGYFIDNQVIIRGPSDAIQGIVEHFGLTLIEGCDLSYLNTLDNPDPSLTETERKQLVLQLYQVPVDKAVESVANEINAGAETSHVYADPNYLVSRSDMENDPCGRPNSDPSGGGGKDFGDPGGLGSGGSATSLAADVFSKQWAFGSQGINLPISPSATGRGVRIAVFDTSPFRVRIPFFRQVSLAFPAPLWFTVRDTPGSYSVMSNHGVFISELIHHVAPGSKIELVHVLDDKGCTRLMPLAKALEAYKFRRSFWTGNLNRHVLNLSLGIRIPEALLTADPNTLLPTLKKAIDDADRAGAVIIAAAGNDSNRKVEISRTTTATATTMTTVATTTINGRMPMQLPAAYSNVIGVAATNPDGDPTCYSNVGDIAAPGGDGGINPDPNAPNDSCAPRTDTLFTGTDPCDPKDMENCKYGVISMGLADGGPQYMIWSGTSFSTAYVSGLAALLYERGTRDQAECLIKREASSAMTPDPVLGQGLINVTNSLRSTACP